ncbi:adenylate/guanylate cyclase domain-containing protein [[Phormidium] sp. ETS-05]|uniref:adenylate/guanylate cyclase domain-containing protein n=1 Tax=[Phormidium] sp. ETS-05 TaxID=222819 RepID=UPI0018EEF0FB|nr:adenylate/guanylate cyclase domain-containing protein [[Phormidium] sp. ETS-05]
MPSLLLGADMNLRYKTLLAIASTLAGLLGVLHLVSSTIVLDGFTQLEKKDALRNVERVRGAFFNYLDEYKAIHYERAVWDETYDFITKPNSQYPNRNLRPEDFHLLKTNFILLLNLQGELVLGKGYDFQEQKAIPIPQELLQQLDETGKNPEFKGILLIPGSDPIAIAAGPILPTEGKAPPGGTLIFARHLHRGEIEHLGKLTQLSITAYPLDNPQLDANRRQIAKQLNPTPTHPVGWVEGRNPTSHEGGTIQDQTILVQALNAEIIAGYTVLPDIHNQPALLLQIDLPREIYRQGQNSLGYLIVSILGVGILFIPLSLLLLEKMVLYRLATLCRGVRHITSFAQLSERVPVMGEDELSGLAVSINTMLAALESKAHECTLERQKVDRLLLNILPEQIATRLKQEEQTIADSFAEVTVLFADIVGFTQFCTQIPPTELVALLNEIFSRFDLLAEQYNLEKIKTIGDAYMIVSGIPVPRPDHAEAMANMALEMQRTIGQFNAKTGSSFNIRIGIHTGPVVAGVIGIKKFIYDLWGDTVNIASRMESHGLPGCIQVTEATYQQLKHKYLFEKRGTIHVKGKGEMTVYLLQALIPTDKLPAMSP